MTAVDSSSWWPVSPFLRRRWRRRLGLPDVFVAEVGVRGAPELDERTAGEALFLCAAAVVGPSHLLPALALGTPTVCTSDAAAAVGAEDGVHVVVTDGGAAHDAALALADDDERAALLARAGRALVDERRGTTADGVDAAGPVEVLTSALAELGTPPGSDVTRRVAAHVASLGPSAAAAVAPLAARAEVEVAPLPDEESAARVAAAFGLTRAAGEVTPPPPPRTIRQRLAGKSAGDIARALLRRARLLRR